MPRSWRNARWCAAIALTALAAGCGSKSASSTSTPSSTASPPAGANSKAAIKASGEQVARDIEIGRSASACEGFTTAARAQFGHLPGGGCAGALAVARGVGGTQGKGLAQLFRGALNARLPHLRIEGDEALYNKVVEARYEEGRWRFEVHGSLGTKSA